MPVKWMLAALGVAAAVGIGTALVAGRSSEPAEGEDAGFAQHGAPQDGAASPEEGSFFDDFGLADRADRGAGRSLAAPDSLPSLGSATGSPPTAEEAADLDEELHLTEAAIESSLRLSQPEREPADAAPSQEARSAANQGRAAASLCRRSGLECRSSADCCPGLACSGGVAGYGTAGRCE